MLLVVVRLSECRVLRTRVFEWCQSARSVYFGSVFFEAITRQGKNRFLLVKNGHGTVSFWKTRCPGCEKGIRAVDELGVTCNEVDWDESGRLDDTHAI